MADLPATTRKRAKAGRKRRVAGWVLLVIGVLITGVWGASRWWALGFMGMTWGIGFESGVGAVSVVPSFADSTKPKNRFIAEANVYDDQKRWNLIVPPNYRASESDPRGWYYWPVAYSDLLSPNRKSYIFRTWLVVLWPFALASLLGGGWLVWSGRRARRRAMTGHCLKCGYDLAGLATPTTPTTPCPECGTVAHAAPAR
ncbi:MAG: hypothetical protein ACREJO_01765 [Phycisphaerales bacterium]